MKCTHICRNYIFFVCKNSTSNFVLCFYHQFLFHLLISFCYCLLTFLCLRWEYYSMIYVRSNNSIRLFPRASLALFLLYHFYLFSSPSGFHLLALLVLFLFLTALMVSTSLIRTVSVINADFSNDGI